MWIKLGSFVELRRKTRWLHISFPQLMIFSFLDGGASSAPVDSNVELEEFEEQSLFPCLYCVSLLYCGSFYMVASNNLVTF